MFEIPKMHKFEDRMEQEAYDFVLEVIMGYYKISEMSELTEEQVNEIQQFMDENVGAVTCLGLQSCLNEWEDSKE